MTAPAHDARARRELEFEGRAAVVVGVAADVAAVAEADTAGGAVVVATLTADAIAGKSDRQIK